MGRTKLRQLYGFLNKCSKELFDYCVGVQRRKEGFLKKERCYVLFEFECQRSLWPQKHKSRISFVKLVLTKISVNSIKEGNHFWSRYFRRVATFGGSLLWELYGIALKNTVSRQVDIEIKKKHNTWSVLILWLTSTPGVLPYMDYTGMCRWTGCGFWPLCPKQGK